MNQTRTKREPKGNSSSSIDVTNVTSTPESEGASQPTRRSQVLEVSGHYRIFHPRSAKILKPKSKEFKAISERLDEGFSVDDLKAAIDGCHRSPYHCGENDQNQKYQSLELIVRDAKHVQQFLEVPLKPAPVVSEKESRSLRAAKQWAQGASDDKPRQREIFPDDNGAGDNLREGSVGAAT